MNIVQTLNQCYRYIYIFIDSAIYFDSFQCPLEVIHVELLMTHAEVEKRQKKRSIRKNNCIGPRKVSKNTSDLNP